MSTPLIQFALSRNVYTILWWECLLIVNAWSSGDVSLKMDAPYQITILKDVLQLLLHSEPKPISVENTMQINIERLYQPKLGHSKTATLDVKLSDTIRNVKTKIHNKWDIQPSDQRLLFCGAERNDLCTLLDCNVEEEDTMFLMEPLGTEPKIKIFFSDEVRGGGSSIEVAPHWDVKRALGHYANKRCVELCRLIFFFHGKEVQAQSYDTLEQLGISNGAMIMVRTKEETQLCGTNNNITALYAKASRNHQT